MRNIFIIFFIVLFSQNAYSAHIYKEIEYQKIWCGANGGILEFKNPDNSRVDCLTDEYAVEFDFAPKWAQAAGQSLYYALLTGKKPAIVLIIENPARDSALLKRAEILCGRYQIRLWVMSANQIIFARPANF